MEDRSTSTTSESRLTGKIKEKPLLCGGGDGRIRAIGQRCSLANVQLGNPGYGGIDKRALAIDPAAIDRELERVRPAMEKGRYIPAIDHCVPDDVSWQNYCHYARQLKKMTSGAK